MAASEGTGAKVGLALNRRELLKAASGLAASSALAGLGWAEEMPAVTHPRATSGDTALEPDWQERVTVTVGPEKADLTGADEKVLQAAVDYVARLGGGTVHVLPGTYRLRNAVYLPSRMRILGSGGESVLIKEGSVETGLAEDSDWYDQEITLADASGFRVGDGVCLQSPNPFHGGPQVVKRTLVARSGNRFKLDKALRENFWVEKKPTVSTLFPMLTAEFATDIAIENIALDGNKANNGLLDGNYAGCAWFQDCGRIAIRGVTARNYHGDGMSWQICHDVVVENCHSHDHTGLGLHPGSGAQRSLIRNNKVERNDVGLLFCWGVKYGLAEKNTILDSVSFGISIGHRDNENVVRDNEVVRSGKAGVVFRPERGAGYTARGNRVENNRIVDSGGDDGVGIDVQGATAGNVIARNHVVDTRGAAARIGIRLAKESGENELTDNQIEGVAMPISDLRKA